MCGCETAAGRMAEPRRTVSRTPALSNDPRALPFHGRLHLFERCRAGIARGGHGEGAVRGTVLHRLLRRLTGQEPVGQAGSEAVAAADTVVDFQILAKRSFVELS